jgi:hypothetical protein
MSLVNFRTASRSLTQKSKFFFGKNQIDFFDLFGVGGAGWRCRSLFFYTKTARKWHIDCMGSRNPPALLKKGLKVVHVK